MRARNHKLKAKLTIDKRRDLSELTDVEVKAAEEIFKAQIAIEMKKVFAEDIQRFDSKLSSFVWCKSDRPIYDRWLWHPMLDNKGMGF